MVEDHRPLTSHESDRQRLQRAAFARDAKDEDRAALVAFEQAALEQRDASSNPSGTDSTTRVVAPSSPARGGWRPRQSIVLTGLVVIAAIAGFAAGATFTGDSDDSPPTSTYPRNGYGLTYGPMDGGETAPDLFAVTAVNGEDGYAYYIQAFGQMPLTPEEAEARPRKTKEVPVYLSDGISQIGYVYIN